MSTTFDVSRDGEEVVVRVSTSDRFERYLQLGHDLSATAQGVAQKATEMIRDLGLPLTFRDRVLVGLMLKIDSAFEALLVDAEACRPEAMHHLKTMTESYIYFRAVADDASGERAEHVLAEAYHRKATMLRETGADPSTAEAKRDALLGGRRPGRWPAVQDVATTADMADWYSQVYRLACEPAHLGDLVDFMPEETGAAIQIGGAPAAAISRARTALHHGTVLMLAIFDELNWRQGIGLWVSVDGFRSRLNAILTSDPEPPADPQREEKD